MRHEHVVGTPYAWDSSATFHKISCNDSQLYVELHIFDLDAVPPEYLADL